MKSKNYIFIAFALLFNTTVWAGTISQDDAKQMALNIIERHTTDVRRAPSHNSIELSYDAGNYYIFNVDGGGWAIVASDDRVRQEVLAYSTTGYFDINRVPEAVKELLNNFSNEIDGLNKHKSIAPRRTFERSVEPLLGEIAWEQGGPYNKMCPIFDGYHCPAGCVNIAIGQIMYYHKYPAVGRGSFSYTSSLGNTYYADFSKSVYQWDLMKPFYLYDGSDTEESENAVALLIRDCGIANSSEYNNEGQTGASLSTRGLVEYFDYDKSIQLVQRDECSLEHFETILQNELDAHRPVFYQGGSQGGAHAFVCDGYNSDGYFHFNFGWGGYEDGYYLTTATGFDSSPGIYYSIMPNVGNLATITASSQEDFFWVRDNLIQCEVHCRIACEEFSTIEIGLEASNKATGEVSYYIKHTLKNAIYAQPSEFIFDDEIVDGDYRLRAVCRVNGREWVHATFHDKRASYVDVNVSNGVKTYTNEEVENEIDPGVVLIDGVYYIPEENRATVTRRNFRNNSYSGDVVIPNTIEYEGRTLPVEEIGEAAMNECTIKSLTIGSNVISLGFGAFSSSKIDSIIFEQPSNLSFIDGWAFNGTEISEVRLPKGILHLSMCAFQSATMTKLELQRSLGSIGSYAFNVCEKLRDVYVKWQDATELPDLGPSIFQGCKTSEITLHVPFETAEIYKAAEQWNELNIVEDQERDDTSAIDLISADEKLQTEVYNVNGVYIGSSTRNLERGVYIIRQGNTVRKHVVK